MCDYIGYEFGGGYYPSSVCIGGYLYDADSHDGRGYAIPAQDEEKIPCPKCNKEEHDRYVAELVDSI